MNESKKLLDVEAEQDRDANFMGVGTTGDALYG